MIFDIRRQTETIPATTDTTITHDKGLPKKTPIKRFGLAQTGVNNGLAGTGIDGYKVKHNSRELWNLDKAHLRALLEALISPLGGTVPAATDLQFTLPGDLYIEGGKVGFPAGDLTIEIDTNASSSAGVSRASWLTSDQEPELVPICLQEAMNVGATKSDDRYDIHTGEGNLVLGFILPMISATGITRLRFRRAVPGRAGQFEDLFHGTQDEIYESQAHYNPEAVTNPFFFKLPVLTDFPEGSYIEIDTGAASAEADKIASVVLTPRSRI